MSNFIKTKIILIAVLFLVMPVIALADDLGQTNNFFVEKSYDFQGREKITAILQKVTDQLYFYFDKDWWDSLSREKQNEVNSSVTSLSQEFEQKIYPILTQNFGSEWRPGIDGDQRITILVQPMVKEAGGYFNSGDEYLRVQVPTSNQREMVYLNSEHLTEPLIKSYLAHEFTHLITFNQKDKLRGISEEIWFNEARADFSPTLLGYDKEYQDSNLQKRVQIFLANPRDSLTEWLNSRSDYGVVNLFTQYLVDHYGVKILSDSLKSSKTGIPSINETLAKQGFQEDFSQIFTDWLIALYVNNCQISSKYCYLNENLKNFKITPLIYFLPTSGNSTLSTGYSTKEWSGLWQKIIGGNENLEVEFTGSTGANFKVTYITEDLYGKHSVNFLKLDENQKGKILVAQKVASLVIIPSSQSKIANFSNNEPVYQFFWTATTQNRQEEIRQQLLAQIASLKAEIARIQAKLNEILAKKSTASLTEIPAGFSFEKNLSFSMTDPDVVYLKIVLEKEVSHSVWSGNDYFGKSTLAAVKAFQEKYKEEISQFAGYQIQASGLVGRGTRAKLNQLLQKYQK